VPPFSLEDVALVFGLESQCYAVCLSNHFFLIIVDAQFVCSRLGSQCYAVCLSNHFLIIVDADALNSAVRSGRLAQAPAGDFAGPDLIFLFFAPRHRFNTCGRLPFVPPAPPGTPRASTVRSCCRSQTIHA
jgi:hypothetical protein